MLHSDPPSCCALLIPSLSLVNSVKRRPHGVILSVAYRTKTNFLNPAFKAVPRLSQAHILPVSIIFSLLQLHLTTVLPPSRLSHAVPSHCTSTVFFSLLRMNVCLLLTQCGPLLTLLSPGPSGHLCEEGFSDAPHPNQPHGQALPPLKFYHT